MKILLSWKKEEILDKKYIRCIIVGGAKLVLPIYFTTSNTKNNRQIRLNFDLFGDSAIPCAQTAHGIDGHPAVPYFE